MMIKLLAADDEPLALLALEKMIQQELPIIDVVLTAKNGREAIELAETLHPQIVLLDIEMPILNGLDAAAMIRDLLPDCHILFLTAYNKFEYAVGALRVRAEDYLVKPVRPVELRDKLSAVCSKLLPGGMPSADRAAVSPFRAKVETHLNTYFAEDISLDQIAGHLNQSPFYFSRTFKQEFGQSFIDYLTNLRLERATTLLTQTELSVREVGRMCGYPDPNYFAKVFKRNRGLAPTVFRQNNQMDV